MNNDHLSSEEFIRLGSTNYATTSTEFEPDLNFINGNTNYDTLDGNLPELLESMLQTVETDPHSLLSSSKLLSEGYVDNCSIQMVDLMPSVDDDGCLDSAADLSLSYAVYKDTTNVTNDTNTKETMDASVIEEVDNRPGIRRSERQKDKEMKQTADVIRKKNAAKPMKKETQSKNNRKKSNNFVVGRNSKIAEKKSTKKNAGSNKKKKRGSTLTNLLKNRKINVSSNDFDVGESNAEDDEDPDRLWCICRKPHNNKFMICCDRCLDWFHGRCVGLTKKAGHDMEKRGQEWTCPTCQEQTKEVPEASFDSGTEDKTTMSPKPQPKQDVSLIVPVLNSISDEKVLKPTEKKKRTSSKVSLVKGKKSPVVLSSTDPKKSLEKKTSIRTCFVCQNCPLESSIFCSESCIVKHANIAKEWIQQNNKHVTGNKDSMTSSSSGKSQVIVMELNSGRLVSGPNAPTEKTLEPWLIAHPTFHVVMPKSDPTSKFYGSSKSSLNQMRRSSSSKQHSQQQNKSPTSTKRLKVSCALTANKIDQEKLSDELALIKRNLASARIASDSKSHMVKKPRVIVDASKPPAPKVQRKSSSVDEVVPETPAGQNIRDNAVKGIAEALKTHYKNCAEDQRTVRPDFRALSLSIEEALYILHNKELGHKYKAKYRSLVFNIKDTKNAGLFQKIISGDILPLNLVNMTAEEMASKELKEWRQAELKHDIDMIKSHELELINMGTKFIAKTHKGERILESDDMGEVTGSKAVTANVIMPDEIKDHTKNEGFNKESIGPKTFEHGNHGFDSLCDVCTGKLSLNSYLLAKIEKERKENQASKTSKEKQQVDGQSSKHRSHHRDHHHHIDKKEHNLKHSSSSGSKSHRHHHNTTRKEEDAKSFHGHGDKPPKISSRDPRKRCSDTKVIEKPCAESEVTSTVTIKASSPEPPLLRNIWSGEIYMPDVASFSVTSERVVASNDEFISIDFANCMKVIGRISSPIVWDYVSQIRNNANRDILVISLIPERLDVRGSYDDFFNYLRTRSRFAVVETKDNKAVKDCYLLPLSSSEQLHPCLSSLKGPGLKTIRKNMLLGLIIRAKRKRLSDSTSRVEETSSKLNPTPHTDNSDDLGYLKGQQLNTYKNTSNMDLTEEYVPSCSSQSSQDELWLKNSSQFNSPNMQSLILSNTGEGFTDQLNKLSSHQLNKTDKISTTNECLTHIPGLSPEQPGNEVTRYCERNNSWWDVTSEQHQLDKWRKNNPAELTLCEPPADTSSFGFNRSFNNDAMLNYNTHEEDMGEDRCPPGLTPRYNDLRQPPSRYSVPYSKLFDNAIN